MSKNRERPKVENNEPKEVPTDDFKKTVEESKNAIHSAIVEPKRRGRGRPRKDDTNTQNQKVESVSPNIQNPQMNQNTPEIKTYLVGPLIAISQIPAHNYRTPELALTPDEAMLCADSVQQILNAFIPDVAQMNPKTAAIFGACVTFSSIGFQKYAILQAKRPKPEPKKEEPKTEAPSIPNNAVPAENYFKSQPFQL